MMRCTTTWVGTAVAVAATVAVGAVVVVAAGSILFLALVTVFVLAALVLAAVALAAGSAVLPTVAVERLSRKACTMAVELTWATSTAAPLAVLMTAQPPTVAASEAEVSRILTLLMAASRRLAIRVCFIFGTILSTSTWHRIAVTYLEQA